MKLSYIVFKLVILLLTIFLGSIFYFKVNLMGAGSVQKTNILIMVAMQSEADCLIKKLSLKIDEDAHIRQKLGAGVYVNEKGDLRLITFGENKRFMVDSIGTQRASLLAWQSIENYHPRVIVNIGTAGGLGQKGAEIGDVYACTEAVYHDRRINLPKFREYGIGHFPCYIPDGLNAFGVKFGVLTTGNSLDTSPTDMKYIKQSGAVVKDMEGAAIAEIAQQNKVKYIAIKSVTDIIDSTTHSTEAQFIENFNLATANLCEKSYVIITKLNNEFMAD